MTDAELIEIADNLVGEFDPSRDCSAGSVASALETAAGNVYTGVCGSSSLMTGRFHYPICSRSRDGASGD